MAALLLRRNRNYRLLFSASALSNLGDGVSALAFPWLATLFTRDAFLIALVAMAGRLPWFLFALPAGVWTDRADRRNLMVRADLLRLVLTLLLIALILTVPAMPLPVGSGNDAIIVLAVLAFLLGSAEVLRDNAAQTILPSVVARADLEHANGQMWSAEQVMGQFIGPPLAGVLIAFGITVPFGFDAATFAIAAVLVWIMILPPRPAQIVTPFRQALVEGFVWMRDNPVILRLAIMLGIINACYMAGLTVLVLYAQEVLRLSAVGLGFLMTAGAAGGVIGGLIAPQLCQRLGLKGSIVVGLLAFAAAYAAFAITGSPIIAALALAIQAFGAMVWNVATVSYRQRLIPDTILGRVNSIYRFLAWGSMPLGALAGGALVSGLETPMGRDLALRIPYACASTGILLVLIYALLRLRTE